ncbi:hypothetical protein [Planctomicrobium piriforme]|uniref:Uncharacterized protein n=1 Tax=Planctomicrobium piriforme TaxID=1576369 RepID=A0A1I3QF96_9PLAN|nr:hypothetical protein [Planctomicrobium piriforme]SFJ32037.1 hypothetical protein SAMN05421753_11854 [Planctomicrobium piriforme]
MNRRKATSWIVAMASLAMMVFVQTTHSPLMHGLQGCEGCHSHGPATASSATCGHQHAKGAGECKVAAASPCGHVHHHAEHSKTDTPAQCSETQCPTKGESPDAPSHSHSHDCQLCQFLTHAAQPLSCPVMLVGMEQVVEQPVSEVQAVVTATLPGPYVRGPPHQA